MENLYRITYQIAALHHPGAGAIDSMTAAPITNVSRDNGKEEPGNKLLLQTHLS